MTDTANDAPEVVDYNHEILPVNTAGQALNSTYWRLGLALGIIEPGEEGVELDLEGVLLEVEERLTQYNIENDKWTSR